MLNLYDRQSVTRQQWSVSRPLDAFVSQSMLNLLRIRRVWIRLVTFSEHVTNQDGLTKPSILLADLNQRVFFGNGKPITGPGISVCLRNFLLKSLFIDINPSKWRHLAQLILQFTSTKQACDSIIEAYNNQFKMQVSCRVTVVKILYCIVYCIVLVLFGC